MLAHSDVGGIAVFDSCPEVMGSSPDLWTDWGAIVRDLAVWDKALTGDEGPLWETLAGGSLVCVAPQLSAVFVVEPVDDGGQKATLARSVGGYGMEAYTELPRTFHVMRIDYDDRHFTLHATDGRSVRATFAQFVEQPMVLAQDANPSYDTDLEQSLAAIPSMYTRDTPLPPPTIHDEILGVIEFDERTHEYLAHIRDQGYSDDLIVLRFMDAPAERVKALLPGVHRILADYERIRREGIDYLWDHGPDDEGTDEEKAAFVKAMVGFGLHIYYSGDFTMAFGDNEDSSYFLDNYWMEVHFRRDNLMPVMVSMEA
jgi:hypothetical protein